MGETTVDNVTVNRGTYIDGSGYFFYVAAARSIDMAETVSVTISKNGQAVQTLETSVQLISEEALGRNISDNARALYTSLLDYGAQAQKFFTNSTTYVNENFSNFSSDEEIAVIDIPDDYPIQTANDKSKTGLKIPNVTLNLADSIMINVYFTPTKGSASEEGKSLYVFKVDGTEISSDAVEINQGRYLVKVTGIKANELCKAHTISATKEGTDVSSSVTLSPMSYAFKNQDSEKVGFYGQGKLGYVCKVFKQFSDACIALFPHS
jgi:hypothetical protein